jgi:hypothetical protein
MATLDNLPADQRAVLQLVLQRGRGYDEIARLLSMDRAAVRERALNAFDALGPQTGVGDQRRALITDYLLGQLPPAVTKDVREHLAISPTERAWARVLASELAPLASQPLPEIPTELAPSHEPVAAPAVAPAEPPAEKEKKQRESILLKRRRNKQAAKEAGAASAAALAAGASAAAASAPAPTPAAAPPEKEKKQRESILLKRRRNKQAAKDDAAAGSPGAIAGSIAAATGGAPPQPPSPSPDAGYGEPRSSRIGGAILIAVGVLIVAGVAAFFLTKSSNNNDKPHTAAAAVSSSSTSAAPAAASGTTTSSSSAHVVAQVNLKPTAKGGKAAGIAEVLKEGANDGIAIVAQNVPPNSTKPPNAYAVWLYNSASDAHFLGFVNPGVGTNGKLSTAGGLPANASHYKQLIVTVETISHPKAPGTIILAGPLSGL